MNELLVKESLKLLKELRDTSLTVDEFQDTLNRAISFLQVALDEESLSKEIYKRLYDSSVQVQ